MFRGRRWLGLPNRLETRDAPCGTRQDVLAEFFFEEARPAGVTEITFEEGLSDAGRIAKQIWNLCLEIVAMLSRLRFAFAFEVFGLWSGCPVGGRR